MRQNFSDQSLAYLLLKVGTSDEYVTKKILQEFHSNLRGNYVLKSDQAALVINSLIGLMKSKKKFPDIIRWCLNIITITPKTYIDIDINDILPIITAYEKDQNLFLAGISAILSFPDINLKTILDKFNIENLTLLNIANLLGKKSVDKQSLIQKLPAINFEKDNESILKAFLILAPKINEKDDILKFFLGNKRLEEILLELTSYSSSSVSQYAYCGLSEVAHKYDINISPNVFADIKDISTLEWSLKFCAIQAQYRKDYRDIINLYKDSANVSTRYGLSSGLTKTFYPGIDKCMEEWILQEKDPLIRHNIIKHMLHFPNDFYQKMLMSRYQHGYDRKIIENLSPGSPIWQQIQREKLLEGNEGMSLFNNNSGKININATNLNIGKNNTINDNINTDSIIDKLQKINDPKLDEIIEQIALLKEEKINKLQLRSFFSIKRISDIITSIKDVSDILQPLLS